MTKAELRAWLRANHPGKAERDRQSALLCQHILNSREYRIARTVGAYVPLAREADVMPVLQDALVSGRTLVLPRCLQAPEMTLHRVTALSELVRGAYGLLEPAADLPVVQPSALDLLIVPLEGVDRRGMRLGKGGGYYDRLLTQADVPTMGAALRSQWVDQAPADPWDKPLQACADERGIHHFK